MNIHKGKKRARNSKHMNTYKRVFFSLLNFLISLKNSLLRTSLVVQWLRLLLSMQVGAGSLKPKHKKQKQQQRAHVLH